MRNVAVRLRQFSHFTEVEVHQGQPRPRAQLGASRDGSVVSLGLHGDLRPVSAFAGGFASKLCCMLKQARIYFPCRPSVHVFLRPICRDPLRFSALACRSRHSFRGALFPKFRSKIHWQRLFGIQPRLGRCRKRWSHSGADCFRILEKLRRAGYEAMGYV